MKNEKNQSKFSFPVIAALLLIIAGGLFALYYLLINPVPYRIIQSATFLDRVPILFDWVQIGPISFPINVDNFLIFQEFRTLPSRMLIQESYIFGGIVFLISVSFLSVLSEFKKLPIVAGGIGWIILLTVSNFNGLNIGGPSANYPLLILLAGSLLPVIIFHIYGQSLAIWKKWIATAISLAISIILLTQLSPINTPLLFLSEHATLLAIGFAIAWFCWNGHGMISGLYILLAKQNKGIGMKISWQMAVISLFYVGLLFVLFMEVRGDLYIPFFGFSPLLLIVPIGILGWLSIKSKTEQIPNLAASPRLLKALHLLGFGIVFWLIWKLIITGNQPALELLKHSFLYTQIGFSIFFIVYLFSNFLSIMDSGKEIDQILYKPYSLPYYHLRIGGLMAIMVLTIYTQGIVATQVNSLTDNILGDYYYQTEQKLEASILYENSWYKYRKNDRAKNLAAQLLFQLNQPTLAKQHLEESFAEVPQVDNIILLSNRLHRENKIFESIFYLENGLKFFPNDPHLTNNLALFYAKVNRSEDAISLLEAHQENHSIINSNLLALKTKMGSVESFEEQPNDLIGQINALATNNALANYSSDELKSKVRSGVLNENSSMIIQAGIRNLFSERNREDPSNDLKLLDSLGKQEAMLDYLMDLQETGVIRSLGAGRVTEAIKNLNGLAFRNPGSAGYYLSLSSQVLAQNLDLKKSSRELLVAEEKGFQAFQPHHLSTLILAGYKDNAEDIKREYQVIEPKYLVETESQISQYLQIIGRFHEYFPKDLYVLWESFPNSELKADLAIRILSHKSHGLSKVQLQSLAENLKSKIGETPELDKFLANPDWQNNESILSFTRWLNVSEELTANPYFTPLILSAAERITDPLEQYEMLNEASLFNHDPILWIRKIQAAKRMNLVNYAEDALSELKEWVPQSKLDSLEY
ncbi:tetratricopeptide repeat protein [Algoriphagus machipongonensis]|uniref:Tetratricopeptide repeat protein n=1 Tax=Algoriphagus machipongonensis TaxID=388413 RepID=A3I311_9BACT|nr:hypothetical protein [Algoriphagus machipongonensis]EAZ79210.1 hypothetical protein ALPR1_14104 [Algoriphagus machipongonensis]